MNYKECIVAIATEITCFVARIYYLLEHFFHLALIIVSYYNRAEDETHYNMAPSVFNPGEVFK